MTAIVREQRHHGANRQTLHKALYAGAGKLTSNSGRAATAAPAVTKRTPLSQPGPHGALRFHSNSSEIKALI